MQAKSLIHVVDKMNQAGTQENYSGKLAKEEKEETEYLKQLEKKKKKADSGSFKLFGRR